MREGNLLYLHMIRIPSTLLAGIKWLGINHLSLNKVYQLELSAQCGINTDTEIKYGQGLNILKGIEAAKFAFHINKVSY